MNYNYHKRLYTNFLSQPKNGLQRTTSEHSYITAANAKYFNKQRITNQKAPIYYNQPNPGFYCHLCHLQMNGKPTGCLHVTLNDSKNTRGHVYQNSKNEQNTSQYFAPQIKTIRNTLLDIRDQMKNKGKGKKTHKNHYRQGSDSQNDAQAKLNFSRAQQRAYQDRVLQKERKILELQQKNQQLSHIILDLQRKNQDLLEDLQRFQNQIRTLQSEVQQHKGRSNRAENQKNMVLERQRALQIRMMDLRADLMTKQQLLRQVNLNESQSRQNQILKKLMMRPSQQISMVVSGYNNYKLQRGAQTNLSQVDIQNGFRELNMMQDNLCDKINGNLKIERKIFARIAEIDDKLGFALDKLYQVQQQASKLGIHVRGIDN